MKRTHVHGGGIIEERKVEYAETCPEQRDLLPHIVAAQFNFGADPSYWGVANTQVTTSGAYPESLLDAIHRSTVPATQPAAE